MKYRLMTRSRTHLTIVAVSVALAASFVGATALAISCVFHSSEAITLELESVTVDGEPHTDTSEYDAFELRLEGSPYDGDDVLDFTLTAADGVMTWRERYE